jgi:hypothetical protein
MFEMSETSALWSAAIQQSLDVGWGLFEPRIKSSAISVPCAAPLRRQL